MLYTFPLPSLLQRPLQSEDDKDNFRNENNELSLSKENVGKRLGQNTQKPAASASRILLQAGQVQHGSCSRLQVCF